jgi:hypothetical protein
VGWAALGLLGFVVVEAVARVEDRVANGIPLDSRVTSPNDLIWLHPEGARGRPNARYRRWALNSHGFRGPEITPVPAPGVARVVAIGASETFGLYESAGRDYPRQLQDSLRRRRLGACPGLDSASVEVVNAALPGMALPTMTRYLDRVVRDVRPAVVVLYPSPGFYLNARPPELSRGMPGADSTLPIGNAFTLRVRERVMTHVKALVPDPVMGWARRQVIERRNRGPRGVRFPEVPPDRLAQLEHDLRTTAAMARSLGVPVVLMGHVNATMAPGFDDPGLVEAWVYQFPSATGRTLSDFHARARDIARQVARDSSLAYVDLPDAFGQRWDGAFADFVHFTDRGAAVVAGALAGAIAPVIGCGPGPVP